MQCKKKVAEEGLLPQIVETLRMHQNHRETVSKCLDLISTLAIYKPNKVRGIFSPKRGSVRGCGLVVALGNNVSPLVESLGRRRCS